MSTSRLRMTIGPLRYEFLAHDAWGREALGHLRRNFRCLPFPGAPARTIHVMSVKLTPRDRPRLESGLLPERLEAFRSRGVPERGWKERSDHTGRLVWHHPRSPHAFWTFGLETPHQKSLYQLPWFLILADITSRGGGVLHGGVAAYRGRAHVFTAPPGGGKTTALSMLSGPWKVLSDDTALVWPMGRSGYRVSPLPTWSVLIGLKKSLPDIRKWEVSRSLRLGGLFLLKKTDRLGLARLPALEAAQHLYRAFGEYPAVLVNREYFKMSIFRTACALARTVLLWELQRPKRGDFWSMIEEKNIV